MGKNRRVNTSGKVESGWFLKGKDICIYIVLAFGITALIAWLFYNSIWGLFVGFVVFPIVWKYRECEKKKQKQENLQREFKEYMGSVGNSMLAGQAAERAFLNAFKDVKNLYGDKCLLVELLEGMESRLCVKEPLEHILRDFAEKSACEDIENFVEVFCYAKRSGGNFAMIIQTTINRISDKMEVTQEIQMVMAEKALEQKIMCIVPLGVLMFFRLTSPEFIGILYGNLLGIVVMTIAILLYATAFFLAKKLTEIEV